MDCLLLIYVLAASLSQVGSLEIYVMMEPCSKVFVRDQHIKGRDEVEEKKKLNSNAESTKLKPTQLGGLKQVLFIRKTSIK